MTTVLLERAREKSDAESVPKPMSILALEVMERARAADADHGGQGGDEGLDTQFCDDEAVGEADEACCGDGQ